MSRYVKCINNKQFIRFKGEPPPDTPIYGLEVGQVYKLAPPEPNDGDMLRVIDGSGEDYLYPASYFEPLTIPKTAMSPKALPLMCQNGSMAYCTPKPSPPTNP